MVLKKNISLIIKKKKRNKKKNKSVQSRKSRQSRQSKRSKKKTINRTLLKKLKSLRKIGRKKRSLRVTFRRKKQKGGSFSNLVPDDPYDPYDLDDIYLEDDRDPGEDDSDPGVLDLDLEYDSDSGVLDLDLEDDSDPGVLDLGPGYTAPSEEGGAPSDEDHALIHLFMENGKKLLSEESGGGESDGEEDEEESGEEESDGEEDEEESGEEESNGEKDEEESGEAVVEDVPIEMNRDTYEDIKQKIMGKLIKKAVEDKEGKYKWNIPQVKEDEKEILLELEFLSNKTYPKPFNVFKTADLREYGPKRMGPRASIAEDTDSEDDSGDEVDSTRGTQEIVHGPDLSWGDFIKIFKPDELKKISKDIQQIVLYEANNKVHRNLEKAFEKVALNIIEKNTFEKEAIRLSQEWDTKVVEVYGLDWDPQGPLPHIPGITSSSRVDDRIMVGGTFNIGRRRGRGNKKRKVMPKSMIANTIAESLKKTWNDDYKTKNAWFNVLDAEVREIISDIPNMREDFPILSGNDQLSPSVWNYLNELISSWDSLHDLGSEDPYRGGSIEDTLLRWGSKILKPVGGNIQSNKFYRQTLQILNQGVYNAGRCTKNNVCSLKSGWEKKVLHHVLAEFVDTGDYLHQREFILSPKLSADERAEEIIKLIGFPISFFTEEKNVRLKPPATIPGDLFYNTQDALTQSEGNVKLFAESADPGSGKLEDVKKFFKEVLKLCYDYTVQNPGRERDGAGDRWQKGSPIVKQMRKMLEVICSVSKVGLYGIHDNATIKLCYRKDITLYTGVSAMIQSLNDDTSSQLYSADDWVKIHDMLSMPEEKEALAQVSVPYSHLINNTLQMGLYFKPKFSEDEFMGRIYKISVNLIIHIMSVLMVINDISMNQHPDKQLSTFKVLLENFSTNTPIQILTHIMKNVPGNTQDKIASGWIVTLMLSNKQHHHTIKALFTLFHKYSENNATSSISELIAYFFKMLMIFKRGGDYNQIIAVLLTTIAASSLVTLLDSRDGRLGNKAARVTSSNTVYKSINNLLVNLTKGKKDKKKKKYKKKGNRKGEKDKKKKKDKKKGKRKGGGGKKYNKKSKIRQGGGSKRPRTGVTLQPSRRRVRRTARSKRVYTADITLVDKLKKLCTIIFTSLDSIAMVFVILIGVSAVVRPRGDGKKFTSWKLTTTKRKYERVNNPDKILEDHKTKFKAIKQKYTALVRNTPTKPVAVEIMDSVHYFNITTIWDSNAAEVAALAPLVPTSMTKAIPATVANNDTLSKKLGIFKLIIEILQRIDYYEEYYIEYNRSDSGRPPLTSCYARLLEVQEETERVITAATAAKVAVDGSLSAGELRAQGATVRASILTLTKLLLSVESQLDLVLPEIIKFLDIEFTLGERITAKSEGLISQLIKKLKPTTNLNDFSLKSPGIDSYKEKKGECSNLLVNIENNIASLNKLSMSRRPDKEVYKPIKRIGEKLKLALERTVIVS
jgi:hypothetical protein